METQNQVTFYTDGGAISPTEPDARLAAWAVIADVSEASSPDIQMISESMRSSLKCPVMKVVGSGLVHGSQTAARGELVAYLNALLAAEKYGPNIRVSVVTDASYVCFVDFAFRQELPDFPNHKSKNFDISVEFATIGTLECRL